MSKIKMTPSEQEKNRRIRVALWAYACEIVDNPIVSDEEFDRVCREIDLSISTGNAKLDKWFIENFDPCTGVWVYKHPGIKRLAEMYLYHLYVV